MRLLGTIAAEHSPRLANPVRPFGSPKGEATGRPGSPPTSFPNANDPAPPRILYCRSEVLRILEAPTYTAAAALAALRTNLSDAIRGFRRSIGLFAKELQQAVSFRVPGALFEKCGGGFHDSNFFGDSCGNPLIQGDAVFLREALCGLSYGMRQLQRISRSAYQFVSYGRAPTGCEKEETFSLRGPTRALRVRRRKGQKRWFFCETNGGLGRLDTYSCL
jgi:hypothetical protein